MCRTCGRPHSWKVRGGRSCAHPAEEAGQKREQRHVFALSWNYFRKCSRELNMNRTAHESTFSRYLGTILACRCTCEYSWTETAWMHVFALSWNYFSMSLHMWISERRLCECTFSRYLGTISAYKQTAWMHVFALSWNYFNVAREQGPLVNARFRVILELFQHIAVGSE